MMMSLNLSLWVITPLNAGGMSGHDGHILDPDTGDHIVDPDTGDRIKDPDV